MVSPLSILGTATQVANGVNNLASVLGFGSTGPVTLGPISFDGFEVPQSIGFGGQQQMTVHKIPGGDRVIDVMGPDARQIDWSGTFLGPDAITRAQDLDALRIAGDVVPLLWGTFFFSVVIAEFTAECMFARAPYRISCTVLRDEAATNQATVPDPTSVVTGGIGSALASASATIQNVAAEAQAVISYGGAVVGAVASIVTPITSALGVQVPILGKIESGLATASAFAGGIGTLTAAGTAAVANLSGAVQAVGYDVSAGLSQAGAQMAAVAAAAPVAGIAASVVAFNGAVLMAGQMAGLAQTRGYVGATESAIAQTVAVTPAGWNILAPPAYVGAPVTGMYNSQTGVYS